MSALEAKCRVTLLHAMHSSKYACVCQHTEDIADVTCVNSDPFLLGKSLAGCVKLAQLIITAFCCGGVGA